MPFENIFPQPRTQGHFSGTRTSSEIVFYNGKFNNFITYFKDCDTSPLQTIILCMCRFFHLFGCKIFKTINLKFGTSSLDYTKSYVLSSLSELSVFQEQRVESLFISVIMPRRRFVFTVVDIYNNCCFVVFVAGNMFSTR